MNIVFGPSCTAEDKVWAAAWVAQGERLLAKYFKSGSLAALDAIHTIYIVDDSEFLGDLGDGTMRLSIDYMKGQSIEWYCSVKGHEGQHFENTGKFLGANLWMDEQSASTTQLAIGFIIGMSQSDMAWLKQWLDVSNKVQLQEHMTGGYHTVPAPTK